MNKAKLIAAVAEMADQPKAKAAATLDALATTVRTMRGMLECTRLSEGLDPVAHGDWWRSAESIF